jgi:hypothetical protein
MSAIDRAAKAETVFALASRIWALLGFSDKVTLAIVLPGGAAWAWFMRIYEQVPTWVLVLTTLLVITLCAKLYAAVRVSFLIRGQRSFDIQAFGEECFRYYQDFGGLIASQQPPIRGPAGSKEDMHAEWQRGVDASNRLSRLILERFGARAFALAHQMRLIGIPPPEMFHFSHGDVGGASVYIGMVGELLKKGQLDAAKKLDPKSTWGVSYR